MELEIGFEPATSSLESHSPRSKVGIIRRTSPTARYSGLVSGNAGHVISQWDADGRKPRGAASISSCDANSFTITPRSVHVSYHADYGWVMRSGSARLVHLR